MIRSPRRVRRRLAAAGLAGVATAALVGCAAADDEPASGFRALSAMSVPQAMALPHSQSIGEVVLPGPVAPGRAPLKITLPALVAAAPAAATPVVGSEPIGPALPDAGDPMVFPAPPVSREGRNPFAPLVAEDGTIVTPEAVGTLPDGTATGLPRVLAPGMTGDDVRQLQERLVERGEVLGVDGVYGPETTDVVRDFQARRGLLVDGLVGPQTWTATGTDAV